MTKPVRHWLFAETREIPLAVDAPGFRNVSVEDAEALGPLMDRAYTNTIDWERETPEQCVEEMRGTLTGKYGPFLDRASFLIETEGRIVSASLVTLYKEMPLLAFSMTDPDFQGRGYGRFLIERSLSALFAAASPALYLAVTEGNSSAQRLYARLGFRTAPESTRL
ncbi:MAG: GNAT family N-acetyltransferase [Bdellovibrionales bacterium]|nr:GNAT family N-acetyltransferase [Bdellovibrionales bacterium]